jgi:hypothetical protein
MARYRIPSVCQVLPDVEGGLAFFANTARPASSDVRRTRYPRADTNLQHGCENLMHIKEHGLQGLLITSAACA